MDNGLFIATAWVPTAGPSWTHNWAPAEQSIPLLAHIFTSLSSSSWESGYSHLSRDFTVLPLVDSLPKPFWDSDYISMAAERQWVVYKEHLANYETH
jgi:hypothetical protein